MLAGCAHPLLRPGASSGLREEAPVPLPEPLNQGYVDLGRLTGLHPATAEVERMEALLRAAGLTRGFAALPVPATAPVPQLPSVSPPAAATPPSRRPNLVRARREVELDYAAVRRSAPDRAEEEYRRELARLTRVYLEQRQYPRDDELASTLDEGRVYAERSARLAAALRNLREQPVDRLLYTEQQMEERRAQARRLTAELQALRAEQVERLAQALMPRGQASTPRIPRERLEELERRRATARAEADRALRAAEAAAMGRLETALLPDSEPARLGEDGMAQTEGRDSVSGPPEDMGTRHPPIHAERVSVAAHPGVDNLRGAIARLRREIEQDLRVAAIAAGRGVGIEVSFTAGPPDRTAEVAPGVRTLLAAPGNGMTRERPLRPDAGDTR
jgi:hypothetical protein